MQYRSSRLTIAILCVVAAGARAQAPAGEARVARLTGRVADAVGSSIPKAQILVTAEGPATEVNYGGFETRRARGFGTFITREDIDKKRPVCRPICFALSLV